MQECNIIWKVTYVFKVFQRFKGFVLIILKHKQCCLILEVLQLQNNLKLDFNIGHYFCIL